MSRLTAEERKNLPEGLSDEGRKRMLDNVEELLKLAGFDTTSPGMKDTPQRFVKYLFEFNSPFDPIQLLGKVFETPGDHAGMITQTGIPFRMICEHHLLPAIGLASIGYIPNKRIVGLSKLSRLVESAGTMRPWLQEGICDFIATALNDHLDPKGVIVVIRAQHTCMASRGVAKPNVDTATSSLRGLFLTVPEVRREFFSLIGE